MIMPYCDLLTQQQLLIEVSARLTVCDSIEQTVDAALQQAEAMRQSILRETVTINQEQTSTIISKVWGMCNPLPDDGVSYGDYLEQLTYLILLKMSDEYAKPPYNKKNRHSCRIRLDGYEHPPRFGAGGAV